LFWSAWDGRILERVAQCLELYRPLFPEAELPNMDFDVAWQRMGK
jgi:hypothetical protein